MDLRNTIDDIYSRLLTIGYWQTLFGDLEKFNDNRHIACCPFHHDHTPSFSFSKDKPLWYCHTEGEGGDWIKYLMKRYGLTFQEALAKLAQAAGIQLNGIDHAKAEQETTKANILEEAWLFFKTQLFTEKENNTLQYLKRRGYQEGEIKDMELGFFPGEADTLAYLTNKGHTLQEVKAIFKYLAWRQDYTLVIPWRDTIGRIKSIWVRLTKPIQPGEKESEKYLPLTTEAKKDTFFNLHEAKHYSGFLELVIVEGFLDACISTVKEISGVVAIGGDTITKEQIENAKKYGFKQATLALDGDKAGQKATEKNLAILQQEGITVFIAELPEDYDPDDLIREKGAQAFQNLINHAISASKWKAKHIVSKYDLTTDKGKTTAIDEALTFKESLQDPISAKDFLDTFTQTLGIPSELLAPKLQDYHDKKAKERLRKEYTELIHDAQIFLVNDQLSDLKDFLEKKNLLLRAKAVSTIIQPYTISQLTKDLAETKPSLKTGFPSLDKLFTIPEEAITVIAGRPSHGKTTFLLNLMLNMVKLNYEKAFFFLSYEETKKQLALKLINILSQTVINETQNLNYLKYCLQGDNSRIAKDQAIRIEEGKGMFNSMTQDKNLWLIDEPYYLDELRDTITYLAQKYPIGAIFIDYIQKIKTKERFGTRQLQIQHISATLLELAKSLHLSLIVGAQLGRDKDRTDKVRLDNLREAGDIEQDANLVLGIYNETMEKSQDQVTASQARVVDLEISILKNRNGLVNESVTMEFDRPILTIREKNTLTSHFKNNTQPRKWQE